MEFYEQITLEEDIMIPEGTEMMGKVMKLSKDTWIEKGDKIRKYPDDSVEVISMSLKQKVKILYKQYGFAIWRAAKLAKHTFISVVPHEEQNKEIGEETKIIESKNDKPTTTND